MDILTKCPVPSRLWLRGATDPVGSADNESFPQEIGARIVTEIAMRWMDYKIATAPYVYVFPFELWHELRLHDVMISHNHKTGV